MEPYEKHNVARGLEEIKIEADRSLNDLKDLRNIVKREESSMQNDTIEAMTRLNSMEDAFYSGHFHTEIKIDFIKHRLKEYDDCASDCEGKELFLLETKIRKLENELEDISREINSIDY